MCMYSATRPSDPLTATRREVAPERRYSSHSSTRHTQRLASILKIEIKQRSGSQTGAPRGEGPELMGSHVFLLPHSTSPSSAPSKAR